MGLSVSTAKDQGHLPIKLTITQHSMKNELWKQIQTSINCLWHAEKPSHPKYPSTAYLYISIAVYQAIGMTTRQSRHLHKRASCLEGLHRRSPVCHWVCVVNSSSRELNHEQSKTTTYTQTLGSFLIMQPDLTWKYNIFFHFNKTLHHKNRLGWIFKVAYIKWA